MGVSNHWTDWIQYWTHIFLAFTHYEITFVVSLQTKSLQGAFCPLQITDEYDEGYRTKFVMLNGLY